MTFDMTSWLEEQSITEVECLVSDIAGIPRGKILPVHKFSGAAGAGGLRLPEYVFGQSVTGAYLDSKVLNEIGADVILRPIRTVAGWCHGMPSRRRRSFTTPMTTRGRSFPFRRGLC